MLGNEDIEGGMRGGEEFQKFRTRDSIALNVPLCKSIVQVK